MLTPSQIPPRETSPFGNALHHLHDAFAELRGAYHRQIDGIVSADAVAAHHGLCAPFAGNPLVAAMRSELVDAEVAYHLLEKFLWATVGDQAALDVVVPMLTKASAVDALRDVSEEVR